jgi:hypothetical protein
VQGAGVKRHRPQLLDAFEPKHDTSGCDLFLELGNPRLHGGSQVLYTSPDRYEDHASRPDRQRIRKKTGWYHVQPGMHTLT